jgi:hypothetical protein
MNWRLVLILLKLIDRFGFPYFLVLVSFWFAKAIEQELQKHVTSPAQAGSFGEAAVQNIKGHLS